MFRGRMSNSEFNALIKRVSTFGQSEIEELDLSSKTTYIKDFADDAAAVNSQFFKCFPLGPRWWKIVKAVKIIRQKSDAIYEKVTTVFKKQNNPNPLILENLGEQ